MKHEETYGEMQDFFFVLNNFILRWYCTITEANKNQKLITINMVKIYHVEAGTKVISMYSHIQP